MARAKRRKFTTEFNNETVKLIRESDRSVGAICRELDLTETIVRRSLKQADVDDGKGPSQNETSISRDPGRSLERLPPKGAPLDRL